MRKLCELVFLVSAMVLLRAVQAFDFDGYVAISGNDFFRLQSNANINDNSGVFRTFLQLNLGYNEIVESMSLKYNDDIANLLDVAPDNSQIIQDILNGDSVSGSVVEFENRVFFISLIPVPRIALRKTTFSINTDSFEFSHESFAMAFPVVYASIPGNSASFPQNRNITWTKVLTGGAWTTLQKTESVTNGVKTWAFSSCRTDIDNLCITFKISNNTYSNDGTTFLPDSVKIDLKVPVVSNNGIQPTNVGVVSTVFYTDDAIDAKDMHSDVDNTVSAASKKHGAKAMCSADFVVQFYSNMSNTGYVNWARSATAFDSNGANADVNVDAHVFGVTASVQDDINVTDADYWSADSQLNAMTVMQYIVYDFPLPSSLDASYVSWDPEIGIAVVSLDNHVVGGGLPAGAIAGIVIASVVVLGVGGFVGWKLYERKKAGHIYRLIK